MASGAWNAKGPFSRTCTKFTMGGISSALPSGFLHWMAPDGQLWAISSTSSAVARSGWIQAPSTLGTNTSGRLSTQLREWMQRLPSNVTVTWAEDTISLLMADLHGMGEPTVLTLNRLADFACRTGLGVAATRPAFFTAAHPPHVFRIRPTSLPTEAGYNERLAGAICPLCR